MHIPSAGGRGESVCERLEMSSDSPTTSKGGLMVMTMLTFWLVF